jgi:hypothetical protein
MDAWIGAWVHACIDDGCVRVWMGAWMDEFFSHSRCFFYLTFADIVMIIYYFDSYYHFCYNSHHFENFLS